MTQKNIQKTPHEVLAKLYSYLLAKVDNIPTAEPTPLQWLEIKDAILSVAAEGDEHAG